MADKAHVLTDKEIEKMERHLSAIYSRAEKELSEKADKYFERFRKRDEKMRELLDAGKIDRKEYDTWRRNQLMTGRHWTEMTRQAAHRLTQADQEAADYINGRLPSVYALNYNAVSDGLETRLKGYSFELVDANTVRNLATQDKTLLPYKYIDGAKAERWHTQRVNAEVLQGILQGESIPKIAKRLRDNVGMSARGSAVRNARTAVTSAENKGRMDMLRDAEEKGVKAEKGWLAAHDARVRESHAQVDGEFVGIDDEFSNGLQFPGDPDGRPEEVYNCRCTLVYKVGGVGASKEAKNIDGRQIEYADALDGDKWNEPKQIINQLTEEYETKLKTVKAGSHQSAGGVQISGTIMHLSSNKPSVAFHEFAHTISMKNQTKFGLYDEADFWREISKVRNAYRKAVEKGTTKIISTYEHAKTGEFAVDEFMAEAFTQAKMLELGFDLPTEYGRDTEYTKQVLKIIDKYFKKKR